MKEILEGLRGPVLGMVMVILFLAGTIVVAAFAALVAQMSLLLRLRPRERTRQASPRNGPDVAGARQAAYSSTYPSPRSAVYERPNEDVVDAVWWQEVQ